MGYVVDPARMALVEDVVRLHAEFGALLDRIADAVDPAKRILDPCESARGKLNAIRDAALGLAVHNAARPHEGASLREMIEAHYTATMTTEG
jgi:hypothetical protein